MAINHAVTIPTVNNAPNPSGEPIDPGQPSPTPENPWGCTTACTVSGHTDTVRLLWDGQYFSLPDDEANDPDFGTVTFNYDPPLE
jgi:hypothetical protein